MSSPPDDTAEDTSPEDTSPEDTSPEDTSPEDTSPEDTSPEDSHPFWSRRRIILGVLVLIILVDGVFLAALAMGSFRRHREIQAIRSPASIPTVAPQSLATPPFASPSPIPACARATLIGVVSADSVTARALPDPSGAAVAKFGRENVLGSPQVFDLVQETFGADRKAWYKALLPIKPNGTTGYLPASSLSVSYTGYHLLLDRKRFALTLFDGCKRKATFTVGIGTGETPTPVGHFYLTGLFKPPDPTTIYGVSIYTLSGFSEVLTDWRLGGIIGLHGTNDLSSIGRNSSHGCIRMRNTDILTLERILPLGTPIVIH
jgi:hypothetical protein